MEYIYQSRQWRAALRVTCFVASYPGSVPSEDVLEDKWFGCPPPSLVSFAGTLVSRILLLRHN